MDRCALGAGDMLCLLQVGACTLLLLLSLYTDVKFHIIPNSLTIPAILAAMVFHFFFQGGDGLIFSMKGFAVGMGLLILPFLLGGTGGGDVKLLGAVGAWMGACPVFNIFLFGAMAGGLMALFYLARGHGVVKGIGGVFKDLRLFILVGQPLTSNGSASFPYTVPVFTGFMAYMIFGGFL